MRKNHIVYATNTTHTHTQIHNRSFFLKKKENVKHQTQKILCFFKRFVRLTTYIHTHTHTHMHTAKKNGENVHTRTSIIAATQKKNERGNMRSHESER